MRAMLTARVIGPASRAGVWQALVCHACVTVSGVSVDLRFGDLDGVVRTQRALVRASGQDAVSSLFRVSVVATQATEVAELAG
jgi:hypothetical protein